MIDLAAGGDGVGGDIDAKSFAEKIVDGLTDANVGFDAADKDFPDAAVAPGGENVGALGAAEGGLGGDASQERGKFGCRGAEALRILFRRGEGDPEDFCAVDEATDVPDQTSVAGDEREQLGLHIDDEEGGVVAVHELGAAEEGGDGHASQNSWGVRSAECGVRNEEKAATLVTLWLSLVLSQSSVESGEIHGGVFGN